MLGTLDPLGLPLSPDGWSGERAADGLDIPISARMRSGLPNTGLRFVGDGKRRAVATRASLAQPQDVSWSPWPLTGATAEAIEAWSPAGATPGKAGA